MACRDPQGCDDQTAKQLLQLCLPDVEVCLHDDNSENMMYDLDLRWPDGRVEAVEVTRATSEPMRKLHSRIARRGRRFDAVESTRSWVVRLAVYNTDVAAVRARIDHLLGLVEQAGLTEFAEGEALCSVAVTRVRRLGVDAAYSFPPRDGRPRIRLDLPGRVWWEQPEAVNAVVEDHAVRNAEKLARSGRAERHLFVLLDSGEEVAWSVMLDDEPPEAPPQLPEAVTTAWVTTTRADGNPTVWRVDRRADRWEVLL
jgi:hypothetical protein